MNEIKQLIAVLQAATVMAKHLHWNTRSFAQHIALDELHRDLLEQTDRFAETAIGIWPGCLSGSPEAPVSAFTDNSAQTFMSELKALLGALREPVCELDDAIESIFDDLMVSVNTVDYKIQQLS